MLDWSQLNGDLRSYLGKLIEPFYKKLGWYEDVDEPWLDRYIL